MIALHKASKDVVNFPSIHSSTCNITLALLHELDDRGLAARRKACGNRRFSAPHLIRAGEPFVTAVEAAHKSTKGTGRDIGDRHARELLVMLDEFRKSPILANHAIQTAILAVSAPNDILELCRHEDDIVYSLLAGLEQTLFKHLALLVTILVPLSPQGEKPFRELIFQPGSALFAMSHASTVVELHGGSLMAAWR